MGPRPDPSATRRRAVAASAQLAIAKVLKDVGLPVSANRFNVQAPP